MNNNANATANIQSTTTTTSYPLSAESVIQLMANIINYLNVSLYEGLFTYNHQQSRASLNSIYDAIVVGTPPLTAPSLEDCAEFYRSMLYLTNVTDTDDPNYYIYKKTLLCHVRALEKTRSN